LIFQPIKALSIPIRFELLAFYPGMVLTASSQLGDFHSLRPAQKRETMPEKAEKRRELTVVLLWLLLWLFLVLLVLVLMLMLMLML
jgi:hypothetical protein